jgi:hypothetical protein
MDLCIKGTEPLTGERGGWWGDCGQREWDVDVPFFLLGKEEIPGRIRANHLNAVEWESLLSAHGASLRNECGGWKKISGPRHTESAL